MKIYYKTFLVFILSSVFFVFFIGKLRSRPISSVVEKEKFWADKVHSKKKHNVIFQGDSRFYRGIDPKSVAEELNGARVMNFGFSSGGHNNLVFEEVHKRLSKSEQVKVIVLGLTPYSLTPKAQENKHFLQEFERPKDEVFKRRFLNPFLTFFDPVRPSEFMVLTDTIKGYHEKFRPNGWVESFKIPYNAEEALPKYVKNFKENQVSEKIIQGLLQQVSIWVGENIVVFGLRMPTTYKMEELENQLSGYKETELKKAFIKVGGEWIDIPNRYQYSSYDGSHLIDTSAVDFSRFIGRHIKNTILEKNNQ